MPRLARLCYIGGVRDADSMRARLRAIAGYLDAHRRVWRRRPFIERRPPWVMEEPALAAWLRSLPLARVEALHRAPEGLAEAPEPLGRWWRQGAALCEVSDGSSDGVVEPGWRTFRVPERKRRQVEAAMAQAARLPGVAWVDWCAGKGHLGRGLASAVLRRPVRFVERQAALAELAVVRARRDGIAADAVVADVLREAVELPSEGALLALHACGALTDRAIERGVAGSARALGLAPCCYHHFPGHDVVPLRSSLARAHPVAVDPPAARFATAEEVVARPRRRRRRRREQAFRLGFDRLQREASGRDAYAAVPALPKSWATLPFTEFVARVAEREGMVVPSRYDAAAAEAAGWSAREEATALSLARLPFRRPLELYLVLDRALWLAGAGYDVSLRQLCPRAVTPRNLWLQAVR